MPIGKKAVIKQHPFGGERPALVFRGHGHILKPRILNSETVVHLRNRAVLCLQMLTPLRQIVIRTQTYIHRLVGKADIEQRGVLRTNGISVRRYTS